MPTCDSCGKELPGEFPFCPFCAAPLTAQHAAPLQEERKVVSVLFCDLVGFTAASEYVDPEDVRARLRPYHARLRQHIEHYGGTVEKFVGDAVMAVFGAPSAHEDDAERAVRAGLTIIQAIGELNGASPGLDLRVRVGINTGEAVVSLDARPEDGEGIVTGDVVNTAARLEGAAPVNAVVVGDQTFRTTSHIFEYEKLAPVTVKGKSEQLVLWRALSVLDRFGSDSAPTRNYRTPFVGRELEKPLLIGVFERAAQQRSVELVTIVGEPGVGKSRLIGELWSYIDAKPELIRWRQGRSLPYGEGIMFWALAEIVKAEAAVRDSDSPSVAAAKLEAVVPSSESERTWLVQRLAPLVGVEPTSPAERRELFTAWRRFLEGLAASRATVLVLEDIHWADDALLEFLEYLVEWSQGVPLLVVCAARPELYERRPGWAAGQRNAHTINLSPLSDRETSELVTNLASSAMIDPVLECAIVERAGGNPLYAEEFVRLVADRGLEAALQEETLPESVQALIAARLDTLSPDRKSLLHDAAVVGKVFWASVVAEMGGRSFDEMEIALHELSRKELVRPARTSSMEGESEYAFWHLLVRDVAYSQIPRAQRSRRHRAAAEWIERKAAERVEEVAEVLAHHYVQALELAEAAGDVESVAELTPPARRFLGLAGERALGLDTAQAEAKLARALELTPPDAPERLTTLTTWADAAFQAGRAPEAAEALDDVLPILRSRGPTEAAARALQLRSRVSQRLGEGKQVELAAEAVSLLEQEPARPVLIGAYEQLANVQMIAGAYYEAIDAADRASSLADELAASEPARALGYRGFARAYLGETLEEMERGLDEMERALAVLIDRGAGRDAAILQNNLAIARYPLHGPSRSLADFAKGIDFCEQRGLREVVWQLEANRPGLLAELGRMSEALDHCGRFIRTVGEHGDVYTLVEVRSVEVGYRLARGEQVSAAEVTWLLETARKIGTIDILVMGLSAAAAAALATAEPKHACSLLSELGGWQGSRATPYYARGLPGMVRIALDAGDRGLAECLTEGIVLRNPLNDRALCAGRAALREYAAEHAEAAMLYAEAAERWRTFGNVPECAYALLGRGRSLTALREPAAAQPLHAARDLFVSMGYKPALMETEALLGETEVVPHTRGS